VIWVWALRLVRGAAREIEGKPPENPGERR